MSFTPEQKKSKFFYAEEDVEKYDVSAELWQPLYSLFHDTATSLLEFQLGVVESPEKRNRPFSILDLGSGTGAEATRILSAFPNVRLVTIDLCTPMNVALRRNLQSRFSEKIFKEQVTVLEGDVFSFEFGKTNFLSTAAQPRGFDAVVSAFMLHHYTADEKRVLYAQIQNALRPGGVFLNIDLFRYESTVMDQYADRFTLDWINRQLTKPEPRLQESFDRLAPDQSALREKWIEHCTKQNIPLIFSARSILEERSIIPTETDLLQAAGFSEIECPMRLWSTGIAIAIK